METEQILQALPHLSIEDRLKIAHAAFELVQHERSLTQEDQSKQLMMSALEAVEDYKPGSALLAFDEIEDEDFYDYTDEDLDRPNSHE